MASNGAGNDDNFASSPPPPSLSPTELPYPNGVHALMIDFADSNPDHASFETRLFKAIESNMRWNTELYGRIEPSDITGKYRLLRDAHKWMRDVDGPGKLLVLLYKGHGVVEPEKEGSTWKHLFAVSETGSAAFNITALQKHAKMVQADVLLCIDCCFAAFDGLPPKQDILDNPNHSIEILAPALGKSFGGGDDDYFGSLAGALEFHTEGITAEDVHHVYLDRPGNVNPGCFRRDWFEANQAQSVARGLLRSK